LRGRFAAQSDRTETGPGVFSGDRS